MGFDGRTPVNRPSSWFDWTDEKVERLKELAAARWPASRIAEEIGCSSRSAVIGKLDRIRRAEFAARGETPPCRPPPGPRPPRAPRPPRPLTPKGRPMPRRSLTSRLDCPRTDRPPRRILVPLDRQRRYRPRFTGTAARPVVRTIAATQAHGLRAKPTPRRVHFRRIERVVRRSRWPSGGHYRAIPADPPRRYRTWDSREEQVRKAQGAAAHCARCRSRKYARYRSAKAATDAVCSQATAELIEGAISH
jgi:hypothetical protein